MSTSPETTSSSIPQSGVLTRMFNGLTEGVAIMDGKFTARGWQISHANPALSRISGYAPDELIGLTNGQLHHDVSDLNAMQEWSQSLPEVDPLVQEGYLKRRDGTTIYVAWTLSALSEEAGTPTQVMITYQNMTANHQLQEALVHSQRIDAVGRLAGGIAHDFNNLISIINGYTEILHQQLGENSKVHKELHEIHQAGQRAATLVHQLLAFGRRQKMAPRVIDLNRLVKEHVDILSRLLGHERSLELDLKEDTGNVYVDPTQLQQVFLNLVLNARDATTEGGRISVRTENAFLDPARSRRATDPKAGEYVRLTVADNGCGMDTATLKTVFEPFFTTKSEGKGTGLGLALAYGVVKQSGGHINVDSTPGEGSTFEVWLPRTLEPISPVKGKLAPLPVTGGRETLLVIEEDQVVCKMIEGILAADGYDVTACTSLATAQVAVERLNGAVHLVIADPGAGGSEMGQFMRKLYREQSGLRLLSIRTQETEPIAEIPDERQAVLPKPFALSSLLYAVRSLLDAKA